MSVRGIYLIGFSGSGKSTIARLVGARLGWPVIDLDRLIVEQNSMSIPEIFEREGETGFRTRETHVLRSFSKQSSFVAATGGGIATRAENRAIMQATGWVINLEARPETLYARIQEQLRHEHPDAQRPLSRSLEQIRELKQQRQWQYALADWTVHTDRLSAALAVDEIVRAIGILEQQYFQYLVERE